MQEKEELYYLLNNSISKITTLNNELNNQFLKTKLLDYLFVKNIISEDILQDFYKCKEDDLQEYYSSLLNEIYKINLLEINKIKKEELFSNYLNTTLNSAINSIVDFNIVEYMNGDYNDLNLFKNESIRVIIDDLLKMSKPFFNACNSFNTNNSHRMMLHNSIDNTSQVANLHERIKTCFTSAIPQQIDTVNVNKFSIIKIDIIRNFNEIVKYNESKKVYNKLNSDTIIIK